MQHACKYYYESINIFDFVVPWNRLALTGLRIFIPIMIGTMTDKNTTDRFDDFKQLFFFQIVTSIIRKGSASATKPFLISP